MKKGEFLNSEIIKVLCDLGHTDQITISDAGLPIPKEIKKIDLAVKKGLPSFLEVLEMVKNEMEIEKIIIADEIIKMNPKVYESIIELFSTDQIKLINHEEFKMLTQKSKAIVRTGECTPYANIILQSGVIF